MRVIFKILIVVTGILIVWFLIRFVQALIANGTITTEKKA